MSRPPDKPARRYTLADAAGAAARIRQLRAEARDPDLSGAFPNSIVDDLDVDAVVTYTETHRQVSARVRAAELRDRSLLVEYQHQRDIAKHERRLLNVLKTGYQLGVHPVLYGEPMGLRSRQAVYDRRTRLARKRADADDRAFVDEGRARAWLDAHASELRKLGDTLIDHRDELVLLVDGDVARRELAGNIDSAGTLMNSRQPSQDFCTAVAFAVHLLRPGAALPAPDPVVREQIARGLSLLW